MGASRMGAGGQAAVRMATDEEQLEALRQVVGGQVIRETAEISFGRFPKFYAMFYKFNDWMEKVFGHLWGAKLGLFQIMAASGWALVVSEDPYYRLTIAAVNVALITMLVNYDMGYLLRKQSIEAEKKRDQESGFTSQGLCSHTPRPCPCPCPCPCPMGNIECRTRNVEG